MITASDFRPMQRNTLQAFVTLTLAPSGIVLCDCALHEKTGRRWLALPGKPQLDAEGRHRKDPATGKGLYAVVVEIPDKAARDRFQQAALAAVDLLLADEPTPSGDRGFGPREPPAVHSFASTKPTAFGPGPRRPRPATEPLPDDSVSDLWPEP